MTPRRSVPWLLAAFALVAMTTGCDDGGSIDVAATSSTTAARAGSTTSSDAGGPTTTIAADPGAPPTRFLEETRPTPTKVALVLHDGDRTREVYRTATIANGDDPAASTILDAELAPDGTVYVVERSDLTVVPFTRPGGTRLARVGADGTATTVKANVTDSELSPDGKRMAIVVLSPDGNGDGSGTQAIRVLDLASGDVENLWSTDVALDDAGGVATELGSIDVVGWSADGSTLIVEESCCDSGAVMLLASTGAKVGPEESWPAIRGDHATYALGTDAKGRVLVQRVIDQGDGREEPTEAAGIEVVVLDPTATSDVGLTPVWTGPLGDDYGERPRYEVIGDAVEGTPLPIAFEHTDELFGASDERSPRRFL